MSQVSISNPYDHIVPSLLRQVLVKDACSALVHGLFRNLDPKSIQNEIQNCPSLNEKYSALNLTPLHFAAMANCDAAIDSLVAKKADVNAQDARGYTPLHHLAIRGNLKGIEKLIGAGADRKAKTSYGATYMDLLRANAPFRPSSPLDPSLFSAHRHDKNRFEPVCLTGATQAVDEIVARPEPLVEIWQQSPEKSLKRSQVASHMLQLNDALNDRYEAFKKNPPKLSVVSISQDDAGKSLGLGVGFCGLIADEPIKRGQIIAEYTGELVTQLESRFRDDTYLWIDSPPIDGGPFRSPAAMANDGFPNACIEHHTHNKRLKRKIDGLPARKLMIALDDIEPGQQITINYGSTYPLKQGKHLEFRPEALRKFLRETTWDQILNSKDLFQNERSTQKERDVARSNLGKLDYLLQTPTSFAWAARQGLITLEDLEKIEEADRNFPFLDRSGLGREGIRRARAILQKDL